MPFEFPIRKNSLSLLYRYGTMRSLIENRGGGYQLRPLEESTSCDSRDSVIPSTSPSLYTLHLYGTFHVMQRTMRLKLHPMPEQVHTLTATLAQRGEKYCGQIPCQSWYIFGWCAVVNRRIVSASVCRASARLTRGEGQAACLSWQSLTSQDPCAPWGRERSLVGVGAQALEYL